MAKVFVRMSKRGRQAALTAGTIKSPHSFPLAIALSLFDIKVTSISVYKAHIIYEALAAENFKQLTKPLCLKKHRGFPESPRVSPSRSVSTVWASISLFKLLPPEAFTMNVRKWKHKLSGIKGDHFVLGTMRSWNGKRGTDQIGRPSPALPRVGSIVDPAGSHISTSLTIHIGALDARQIILDFMPLVTFWHYL